MRLVKDEGADPNAAGDDFGLSAIDAAAVEGHADVVLALCCDCGAEFDGGFERYWTPLWHATWNGHADVATLLVEFGANVDKVNKYGESALSTAATLGAVDAARMLLLDLAADVEAVHSAGQTSLFLAAANGGRSDVVQLMLASAARFDCGGSFLV